MTLIRESLKFHTQFFTYPLSNNLKQMQRVLHLSMSQDGCHVHEKYFHVHIGRHRPTC